MAEKKQPERGIARSYRARYRQSVGPATGWDDSQDRSMPAETGLAVAENVRIHDGIIVSRGGQSLVSDTMDGAIVGMIETLNVALPVPGSPNPPYLSLTPAFSTVHATAQYLWGWSGTNTPPMTLTLQLGDGSAPINGTFTTQMDASGARPATPGTYRAYATVTSAPGNDEAAAVYIDMAPVDGIEFTAPGWGSPTLYFYWHKPVAGRQVTLDLRPTMGNVDTWAVAWGDGNTDSGLGRPGSALTHTYGGDGTYNVSISIKGPTDESAFTYSAPGDFAAFSVVAGVESGARIATTPTDWYWWKHATGREVVFLFDSIGVGGTIVAWALDCGDGTTFSAAGNLNDFLGTFGYLAHTYAANGTYWAKMTYTTGAGNQITVCAHVMIEDGKLAVGRFQPLRVSVWQSPSVSTLYLAFPMIDATCTWNVNLGDGTIIAGTGSVTDYYTAVNGITHTYSAGTYTVTSQITSTTINETFTVTFTTDPVSFNAWLHI